MGGGGEHRGHRLVTRRGPRGRAVYRVPERYAELSVSGLVRALAREGWSRAEISSVTGIRYQQVRNALADAASGATGGARPSDVAEQDHVEVDAVGSHVAFADLVARVERGAAIRIERRGDVVARLVPAGLAADDAVAAACRRMDALAEQATLGDATIRELIDAGRRY